MTVRPSRWTVMLVGFAGVAVALAFWLGQPTPQDRVREAEKAYAEANPPYRPPPAEPIIVVPAEVAGPQFGYDAGPGGAPAEKNGR